MNKIKLIKRNSKKVGFKVLFKANKGMGFALYDQGVYSRQ